LAFFFFEALSDFLEDLSFFFFLSDATAEVTGEATADVAEVTGEGAAATGAGAEVTELTGAAGSTAAGTASTTAGTASTTDVAATSGGGAPVSCAISAGVSEPPDDNFAKISGETEKRAGAAIVAGAATCAMDTEAPGMGACARDTEAPGTGAKDTEAPGTGVSTTAGAA